MDLDFEKEYAPFRREVRHFLSTEWPGPEIDTRERTRNFRLKATRTGLINRHIPTAYGGSERGHDPIASKIVREEFGSVGAPGEAHSMGTHLLASTLVARGAEWQKRRFIEPTLLGDIVWCQGYSEPEAGSDLASLRTSAVLEGDRWVINGQKIWTSHAHYADYMFLLARTEPDAPQHRGISYLLLDMTQPGVTIRPLRQMLGGSSFNEVLFDNATTPGDWIVGNRGDGWSVSRSTLTIERASISSPDLIDDLLRRLKQYARQTIRDGKSLLASDHYQQVFAKLEAHALAHRYSVLRQVSMDLVGEHPGVATLVNKLYGTDVGLKIAELAQDLIGDDGLLMPMEGATHENMDWPYWVMRSLAITIAGGASNIQRNIIGERGLGLPRDQMRRT